MRVPNIIRNVGLNELIIPFITEDQWHIFWALPTQYEMATKMSFSCKKKRISSQQLNI